MPKSFDILLDTMDSHRSAQRSHELVESQLLDPVTQALAALVSKCIFASYDNLKLIHHLVATHGMRDSTFYVLVSVILEYPSEFGLSACSQNLTAQTQLASEQTQDLLRYVGDLVIGEIPNSPFGRHLLRESSERIFNCFQVEWVLPKLICGLIDALEREDRVSNEVIATLAALIEGVFWSQICLDRAPDMINVLVSSLDTVEIERNESSSLVGKVCTILGGRFRRRLLGGKSPSTDHSFGNLLASVGKAMFAEPSSMVRLTLLGGIVGDSIDESALLKKTSRQQILCAITGMVQLCVAELEMVDHCLAGKEEIFRRLSPLLLLRRFPAIYFQVARIQALRDDQGLYDSLRGLARQLSRRLGIGTSVQESTRLAYTSEERRLAAEVAGRCLPFGDPVQIRNSSASPTVPFSAYSTICHPSFATALRAITVHVNAGEAVESTKQMRAALYAACHHVPNVHQNDLCKEDAYRFTASVVFNVINMNADELEEDISQELVQLQAGCIEFIASCIERTLQDSAQKALSSHESLVREESGTSTEAGNKECDDAFGCAYNAVESIQDICRTTISIIQLGSAPCHWLDMARRIFQLPNGPREFSVAARTCLWNAVVIVSQRCAENGDRLNLFAKSTASWVVEWGTSGATVNVDLRHPLCVAGALQVVFILITRTKLFACLGQNKENQRVTVRNVHRWALNCIKYQSKNSNDGDDYSRRTLRRAALKLLLALITVDQLSRDDTALPNSLGPSELGETFTMLQSIANLDSDQDMQKMANSLLNSLRMG